MNEINNEDALQSRLKSIKYSIGPKAMFFFQCGAGASLLRYDVLYYNKINIPEDRIGLLKMTTTVSSFIGSLLFGYFVDRFGKTRHFLFTIYLLNVILCTSVLLDFIAVRYGLLLLVILIVGLLGGGTRPIIDNFVLSLCEARGSEFGKQRLWSAIGWGVVGLITGFIVTETTTYLIFIVYMISSLLAILCLAICFIDPQKLNEYINNKKLSNKETRELKLIEESNCSELIHVEHDCIDDDNVIPILQKDEEKLVNRNIQKPVEGIKTFNEANTTDNNLTVSTANIEPNLTYSENETKTNTYNKVSKFYPLCDSDSETECITATGDQASKKSRMEAFSDKELIHTINTKNSIFDAPAFIKKRLNSTSVFILLLANLFVFGFLMSPVEVFLFIFMKDELKASESMLGISLFIMTMSEIPVFYFSEKIIKSKLINGYKRCILISQLFLCVRLYLYTVLVPSTRYYIYFVETLHGITFALLWIVTVRGARDLAPKNRLSFFQGIVAGVYEGFGLGLGSFLGGVFWKILTPHTLFRIYSFATIIYMIIFYLLFPDGDIGVYKYKDKDDENLNKVQSKEITAH